MAQNFLACDREQELLLPPSLREWLPDDHLAWFVLAAVEEMDLGGFYAAYRRDGHGRAAHDPALMVALLLYAYATGRRSSRAIERACVDDVAVRVVAANQRPDHCTIARFRQRHEAALAGLFGDVLALCADAGLVGVAVLAVDGTKVHANRLAAPEPRLRQDRHGDPGGGGRGRRGRGRALRRSPRRRVCHPSWRRCRVGAAGCGRPSAASTRSDRLRRRPLRPRAAEAKPIAKSRSERLREGKRRLEEDHNVHCRANEAYEAYRARGVMMDGRRGSVRGSV
jgi:transposase